MTVTAIQHAIQSQPMRLSASQSRPP